MDRRDFLTTGLAASSATYFLHALAANLARATDVSRDQSDLGDRLPNTADWVPITDQSSDEIRAQVLKILRETNSAYNNLSDSKTSAGTGVSTGLKPRLAAPVAGGAPKYIKRYELWGLFKVANAPVDTELLAIFAFKWRDENPPKNPVLKMIGLSSTYLPPLSRKNLYQRYLKEIAHRMAQKIQDRLANKTIDLTISLAASSPIMSLADHALVHPLDILGSTERHIEIREHKTADGARHWDISIPA